MGIKDTLLGTFGIKQGEYPTLKYRGATFHFRVQTGGDEKWAMAQASLRSLVAVEAATVQDHLVVLCCVTKMVDGKGEVSYPWKDFLDTEKLADDKKFGPLLVQAGANPEAPPVEVQRAAALAFLEYLDGQPSGILSELLEFYSTEIKPLGDAMGLTRYICDDCAANREMPLYEPPIRETQDEPPFCESCGKQTRAHSVIRQGGVSGGNPFS